MSESEQCEARISGFLMKTYEILESEKYGTIIGWNQEGNGFIVYDIKAFSESVLPAYFKHSNFQSFVRQLNMYGFHKIRTPKTEILYTHMLFCRGKKHLVKEICRKVEKKMVKASGAAAAASGPKHSQKSIDAGLNAESPRKRNQLKSRALVGNLININWSLLEEQCFLFEEMKKEWNKLERVIPVNMDLLQLYKENVAADLSATAIDLAPVQRLYRDEKEKAIKAIDSYLEVNRMMLSKLYVESGQILQHDSERFAETNTSLD